MIRAEVRTVNFVNVVCDCSEVGWVFLGGEEEEGLSSEFEEGDLLLDWMNFLWEMRGEVVPDCGWVGDSHNVFELDYYNSCKECLTRSLIGPLLSELQHPFLVFL